MTPLKHQEYFHLKLSDIPEDVVEHYNLKTKATKYDYIFIAIKRRMYGLPQSELLAQELIEEMGGKRGYYQSEYTQGRWLQKTRIIAFYLCVDNFGVNL